jgi:ArsR family transcriptional regulator, arsenate/arsenite/antimonite-responsive transcriptional repressor
MSQDSFNEARAELFEALGHPMRIKILEALEAQPMGFAELKKHVDIESSGHLQFHLRKLGSLVRGSESGTYALTDDGREALRVFRTTAHWTPHGNSGRTRLVKANRKTGVAALLLGFAIIFAAFAASGGLIYTFGNQMSTHLEGQTAPSSLSTIGFNGTGGRWVDFNIQLGGLPAGNQTQQVIPIRIQLAHVQGIDLDSLKLEFLQASNGCCWAFDSVDYGGVEGYPPPSAKLYSSPGDTALVLQDFGFVGTGSVNIFLNLVLDRVASQTPPPIGNGSISLAITMRLQDSGHLLVTNDYQGNAYVSMTLQTNGLLTIDRVS